MNSVSSTLGSEYPARCRVAWVELGSILGSETDSDISYAEPILCMLVLCQFGGGKRFLDYPARQNSPGTRSETPKNPRPLCFEVLGGTNSDINCVSAFFTLNLQQRKTLKTQAFWFQKGVPRGFWGGIGETRLPPRNWQRSNS